MYIYVYIYMTFMKQIHIGWQLVSNYIYISAVNRSFFFIDYSHIFLNFIAINPT